VHDLHHGRSGRLGIRDVRLQFLFCFVSVSPEKRGKEESERGEETLLLVDLASGIVDSSAVLDTGGSCSSTCELPDHHSSRR